MPKTEEPTPQPEPKPEPKPTVSPIEGKPEEGKPDKGSIPATKSTDEPPVEEDDKGMTYYIPPVPRQVRPLR